MLFLEFILALWWLWIPALIIWLYIRSKNNRKETLGSENDLAWHNYIASFKEVVRTKAEKNLINAILERKTADQLYGKTAEASTDQKVTGQPIEEQVVEPDISEPTAKSERLPTVPRQIDNTLLLLYFGAFLLVASAGLFVAIGDFSGGIRTALLALTAAALYICGWWLYLSRPKLAQAGISFMAVGMLIVPLIGVAWYNLIANQSNGPIIWLATSLACLAVFWHAYSVINNSFTAYLLIGAFVSVVESSVLTLDLPIYVFAWAAIGVSLVLQLVQLRSKSAPNISDASGVSAQLLVPLSIISSVILLPDYGSIQFAVSLLIASSYYGMAAWRQTQYKSEYAVASQLTAVAAVGNLAYSIDNQLKDTALALAITGLLYTVLITLSKQKAVQTYNLVLVASIAIGASIALSVNEPWPLVYYTSLAAIFAFVIWVKLRSSAALGVGGALLLVLPVLIGQYALGKGVSDLDQHLLYAAPIALIYCLALYGHIRPKINGTYEMASYLYIVGTVILLVTGWLSGFGALFTTVAVLCALFVLLQKISKEDGWWVFAATYIFVPMLYAMSQYGTDDILFSISAGLALVVTIAISLLTREQIIRGLVVVAVLIAPLAIGGGGLGFAWQEAGFSFGYLMAMAGCLFGRAVARGKLLVSPKVKLSSYDTKSSQAYVAGYVFAAITALVISLNDTNSQLVTTLVLATVAAATIYIALYLEEKTEILILLPFLAQGMLFSALRPELSNGSDAAIAALSSTLLAGAIYGGFFWTNSFTSQTKNQLLKSSLVTAYFGPVLTLFGAEISEAIPVSLGLAGILTLIHNWKNQQTYRELSIAVIIVAVHWLIYLLGITNIHVHTHLLAVFLAGFAYWRYLLNDKTATYNYIVALFLIATIPLVLQALAGESGDRYGLLLIAQQVGFMLVGVLLNIRFFIKAGLIVALSAVLYQLRGLGWAFLALIALILIGVAVYRLQKHSDN